AGQRVVVSPRRQRSLGGLCAARDDAGPRPGVHATPDVHAQHRRSDRGGCRRVWCRGRLLESLARRSAEGAVAARACCADWRDVRRRVRLAPAPRLAWRRCLPAAGPAGVLAVRFWLVYLRARSLPADEAQPPADLAGVLAESSG